MASSLNKVTIIGNVGKEPDIRDGSNGKIANLTIATTESWKAKDGTKQDKTEWHRVVTFGKLSDVIENYVKKGDKVYFEGKLQTRQWTDKDGVERYTTEIVVDSFNGKMIMLGNAQGGNKPSNQVASQEPDFDDDIPF